MKIVNCYLNYTESINITTAGLFIDNTKVFVLSLAQTFEMLNNIHSGYCLVQTCLHKTPSEFFQQIKMFLFIWQIHFFP